MSTNAKSHATGSLSYQAGEITVKAEFHEVNRIERPGVYAYRKPCEIEVSFHHHGAPLSSQSHVSKPKIFEEAQRLSQAMQTTLTTMEKGKYAKGGQFSRNGLDFSLTSSHERLLDLPERTLDHPPRVIQSIQQTARDFIFALGAACEGKVDITPKSSGSTWQEQTAGRTNDGSKGLS